MTAQLFKFTPVPRTCCSFCKRDSEQTAKLIPNNQSGDAERWICDECTKLLKQTITEDQQA